MVEHDSFTEGQNFVTA